MDKKPERAKARVGIQASSILLCVFIFFHILGSDLAKQPGLLRNIRLVFDILLKNHLLAWETWYTENFYARFLMWLLTAISAVCLVASICAYFGWFIQIPIRFGSISNIFDVDTDEEEAPSRSSTIEKEESHTQTEFLFEKNHERAMERLKKLQDLCQDESTIMTDPCVRVQMLSGNPNQRIDQLLEWFGSPDSYYAALRLNAQYEILLELDESGTPCIVGLSDTEDGEETAWYEDLYPLDADGIPTVLMRANGRETVDRYALTWLGGRNT